LIGDSSINSNEDLVAKISVAIAAVQEMPVFLLMQYRTKYNRRRLKSRKGFTLKQLIRALHIDSPVNSVMCLLGKKYPEDIKSFQASGLPGAWLSEMAGKRMKLPIPETWETQIASRGNIAAIWESLIDNSKLPYMAMLRNIRNLILSGISPKHHEKVLKHLENKNAVVNSRQLPIQFYEAFKTVVELELLIKRNEAEGSHLVSKFAPKWKIKWKTKMLQRIKNASSHILNHYKSSISKALELSALHNLHPVPGKTLVICDLLNYESHSAQSRSKVYPSCIMLALMCLRACEDCKVKIVGSSEYAESVTFNNDQFLSTMKRVCEKYEQEYRHSSVLKSQTSLSKLFEHYLEQRTVLSEKLDHIIYLRCCSFEYSSEITSFLRKYREIVNPELLYTDVAFTFSSNSFENIDLGDGKDVYLCGNSAQLLKFIAERSTGEQLLYIDGIDEKYNLTDISKCESKKLTVDKHLETNTVIPLQPKIKKWHTVRIFISSTFKDMHAERDMLIRYVIPELKKRASSICVKINEVDLRWGITEADCSTKRATELCLLEAQKCDYFIGILGERYGTIFKFETPDSPELKWVQDYPSGLSVTELEVHAGALREPKLSERKSFFYFRDNSTFIGQVPMEWKLHFMPEDDEAKLKVGDLKSKILASGLKVYNGYPAQWAGVHNDKPILGGLDQFGYKVLEDLWNAITQNYKEETYSNIVNEEELYQSELLDSCNYLVGMKNLQMDNLLKMIKKEGGIFVITGPPGGGKTAFVVNMLQSLSCFRVIKFFIGVSPRSTDTMYMLRFIMSSITMQFPSLLPKSTEDIINQFPDVLIEAAKSSGGRPLLLLIDGLDHLEPDDQMLDWLPFCLPSGFRFICTTSESSHAFRVLCERQESETAVIFHCLDLLNQSDRASLVRHYLKKYGKSLDESSFNNQMLQIITKRDSCNPLYLRTACDFLRIYASFDNFMSMLQSMPSTLSLLFGEILLQMENEYSSIVIQTALTILCITKEGLDDKDLHFVLSFFLLENSRNEQLSFQEMLEKMVALCTSVMTFNDNILSQIKFCSLIHLICVFTYGHNRSENLNLNGSEFEKSVRKFYANKNYGNFARLMHRILAAHYYIICDPKINGKWNGNSGSAFRCLLYHLLHGHCYQELSDLLCCQIFLESVFECQAADNLLSYFSYLLQERKRESKESTTSIDYAVLSSYHSFVIKNFHIFRSCPQLVGQQALNEPKDSLVQFTAEDTVFNTVECISRSSETDLRLGTLDGFMKNVTAVACENSLPYAVLGSSDGYLRVMDITSRKVVRRLKSHVSTITFICFAGKNRICVASADTTLSIWSSNDYNRIAVLKGHRHNVTGCCADSSGSILLSSSWDNSVRLWSLRDGKSLSVISDFRCPVNCISHHPIKQQAACGLWNGNIEVWDTVSLERKLVLLGYGGSVKSVSYTLDGINIIASYINSELIIWSSEQGLKISSLKGHALPVKCITYSPAQDIISGSDDCTLKMWPSRSGYSFATLDACKYGPISLVEFITLNSLAVAFQNSEIWVMDINSGHAISKYTGLDDRVSCFSKHQQIKLEREDPEAKWCDSCIVFGTQSGNLLMGDSLTSSSYSVGHLNARITSIIHTRTIIFCGSSGGDIGVFSLPKTIYSQVVTGAHEGSVTALSIFEAHNELWAVSAGIDKRLKFWTLFEEFQEEPHVVLQKECPSKHKDNITCLCYLPSLEADVSDSDFKSVLTGSHDNNIILHQKNSETIFQGLQTSITNIGYNDNYILGCAVDGSVALWSRNGNLLSYIPGIDQSSAILAFRIDKDVRETFDVMLAFVDKNGSVKVKKPLQKSYWYSLEGHSKPITSCSTNENGELLSCSLDGSVSMWKIPVNEPTTKFSHTFTVNGLIFSTSSNLALSADLHGSVILWKIKVSEKLPLIYAVKKTYVEGSIQGLSWLKENHFVCAVSQSVNSEDKYMLDVLSFKTLTVDEQIFYEIRVEMTHHFQDEISCVDACPNSKIIVVGLKSGECTVISPDCKRNLKV
ncbi:telomerase protein component 1-like, partial [Stegodyphus dumicola]|uniref:telomerase protein component 1-like n=1 Tax=Stegodyphus dumicola TaxID=202533 RepID=UPI0015ADF26A